MRRSSAPGFKAPFDVDPEELLRDIPEFPFPGDFAVQLGLKKSRFAGISDAEDELERAMRISDLIARLKFEPEPQQDAIWASFCANHLPATVAKFINFPPASFRITEEEKDLIIHNAYFEMLVAVQHSPYFAKYLRSSDPCASDNKRLAGILASRLLALSPRWDQGILQKTNKYQANYYVRVYGKTVELLGTLCTAYVKENMTDIIPRATKDPLSQLMLDWFRRDLGGPFGKLTSELFLQLNFDNEEMQWEGIEVALRDNAKEKHKKARKEAGGWDKCGLFECEKRKGLKSCGRCKTIRYCCPDHQRSHWSILHKYQCHPTLY